MKRTRETVEESELSEGPSQEPAPGLVLVWSCGRAMLSGARARACPPAPATSDGIDIGRGAFAGAELDDERLSRQHVKVVLEDSHDRGARERWRVTDLDSRNGTFVDGERVIATRVFDASDASRAPCVLRAGRSLFVFSSDVRRFEGAKVERRGNALIGPTLAQRWLEIMRAAHAGDALLVTGESGVGKELAARAFHDAGPRPSGPFVAVNCAAIPEGVAERLLFGTRRGAYSGATTDADGYVQAADRGTLFLDEVAELDPSVQAKLLRVLETKEVMELGAARATAVDVRVVCATRDLRAEVAAGRFREDLYFRIGRPEVALPALRDRREEIPWLVCAEIERAGGELAANVSLVEACLLRAWPGNVRELLGEIRRAARETLAEGRTEVEAKDLGETAGVGFVRPNASARAHAHARDARDAHDGDAKEAPSREAIEDALRTTKGNVTRAARTLGVHRNQLRRWIAKAGITAK